MSAFEKEFKSKDLSFKLTDAYCKHCMNSGGQPMSCLAYECECKEEIEAALRKERSSLWK